MCWSFCIIFALTHGWCTSQTHLLFGCAANLFDDCWMPQHCLKSNRPTVYLHLSPPVADGVQRKRQKESETSACISSVPPMLNWPAGGTRRAQYVHRLSRTFDVVRRETRAVPACVSSFVAECCCFSKSGSFCQAACGWIYGCIMFAIMTHGLPRVASICGRTRGGRCSPPSWTGCCEQHRVDK